MEENRAICEALLLYWNKVLYDRGLISESLYRKANAKIVDEYRTH